MSNTASVYSGKEKLVLGLAILFTYILMIFGNIVTTTGSGMACPDWPLCYGQFFPRMVGGVLFEHGHRLLALAVAVLATTLAVLVFRSRRDRAACRPCHGDGARGCARVAAGAGYPLSGTDR